MKVTLNLPRIEDTRVIFSWKTDGDEEFIKDSTFYYDFGVSIKHLSRDYFDFLQVGILLSIWKDKKNVNLVSKYVISEEIISHWKKYWDFDGLTYNPPKLNIKNRIKAIFSREKLEKNNANEGKNVGLLFGGGKDSMMGAGVLDELISGDRELILLSFLHPNSLGTDFARKLRNRRDKLVLEPVSKILNVDVKIIETDLLGRAKSQKVRYSPHIAIYSAAMPIISELFSISEVYFNYEMPHYWVYAENSTCPTPYFSRSRPEYLDYSSIFISKLLKKKFYFGNMSYSTNIHLHFKILEHRYPNLWNITLTCERKLSLSERYCHECHKCFFTLLFGLISDNLPAGLNPNQLLSGPFFNDKIKQIIPGKDSVQSKNTNYPSNIFGIFHQMDFTYWMTQVKPENYSITEESKKNLQLLKTNFGNELNEQVTKYYNEPHKYLPNWFRLGFEGILNQYAEPSANPSIFYFNNKKVRFDFDYDSLFEHDN